MNYIYCMHIMCVYICIYIMYVIKIIYQLCIVIYLFNYLFIDIYICAFVYFFVIGTYNGCLCYIHVLGGMSYPVKREYLKERQDSQVIASR